MFKPNTLFVIGAGASSEFGLPLGSGLLSQIRDSATYSYDDLGKLVANDGPLIGLLKRKYQDTKEIGLRGEALNTIKERAYYAESIDRFIQTYSDNPYIMEMGKLLIFRIICQAERDSLIFQAMNNGRSDGKLDSSYLGKTWIDTFIKILFDSVDKQNVEEIAGNINIICFNYDRCIEFCLLKALQEYFQISEEEASRIVDKANIIHPYGTIGKLPSMSFGARNNALEFGYEFSAYSNPWPLIENLRTFSESTADESIPQKISELVASSRSMVFLGFGFHPQNMKLLTTDSEAFASNIYSTGINISEIEIKELEARVDSIFRGGNRYSPYNSAQLMRQTNCHDLMKKIRQTITLN